MKTSTEIDTYPLSYVSPWTYAFFARTRPTLIGYGSDQVIVLHEEGKKLLDAASLLKKYKTGVRSVWPTTREGA